MGVFDLPAKSAVLSAKQYNGKYGCSVCLHPGSLVSINHRVCLPVDRTHQSVVTAASETEARGESVCGIIRTSPLMNSEDVVDSIPVHYMHTVLEGVTRILLKAWFLSSNHGEPYHLGNYSLSIIDKILLKQLPPSELS